MKTKATTIIAVTIAIAMNFAACSNEEQQQEPQKKGEQITITATLPAADTRLAMEDQLNGTVDGTVKVTWEEGDQFEIANTGYTDTQTFTLVSGAGTNTATFTGTKPESDGVYFIQYPSFEVDYTTQTQTGNASTAHLGNYNCMFTGLYSEDLSDIEFEPLASLMKFDITLPAPFPSTGFESLQSLTLSTTQVGAFVLANTPSRRTPDEALTLTLNGISLLSNGNRKVTAYMMLELMPSDRTIEAGQSITIELRTSIGVYTFTKELGSSQVYEAGKAYTAVIGANDWTAPTLSYYDETVAAQNSLSLTENYAGGNGTKDDPYQIASASQLRRLALQVGFNNQNQAGKYFKLTTNIYVWSVAEWKPIGSEGGVFSGNFDGGGHTISGNLTGILRDNFGVFGLLDTDTDDMTIENLYVSFATPDNNYRNIGGIIGQVKQTGTGILTISNCHNSGKIDGAGEIGGIVGLMYGQHIITGCSNRGVLGHYQCSGVGGIVGNDMTSDHNPANFTNNRNTATEMLGKSNVGGLYGTRTSATPLDASNTSVFTPKVGNRPGL
ncbi:hypothetical protein D0T50_11765 [Bacteroides sp. 214]|uniref:hypothetical protein n=1 Tax=Bacteroides sp. 214 TaxID=2302935 RepID=UPI0013CFD59E|nr:hypothetical protein [Bacteroides sp. 214]NDW13561.1 hypothetical protein [Bacteroides sp. 214]